MPTISQCFSHYRAADTFLTAASCGRLHQDSPSILSFVRNLLEETAPCRIVNGLCQHSTGKTLDVQIFNSDNAIAIHKPATQLVLKVVALIEDLAMRGGYSINSLFAALRAALATGEMPLLDAKRPLCRLEPARIGKLCSVGKSCIRRQSYINTNGIRAWQKHPWLTLNREANVPALQVTLNRNRLDLAFYRTMQLHLDLARALNAKLSGVQKLATVLVGRECDAVVTAERLIARKSGLCSLRHTGKERLERLIHSLENVLATGKVSQRQATVSPHRLELVRLVVIIDRFTASLPCVTALLNRTIIKVARFPQLLRQELGLRFRRIQAVLEGEAHLFSLLPFDIAPDCRFADGSHGGGKITSGPKGRKSRTKLGKFRTKFIAGVPFQAIRHLRDRVSRISLDKQMYVIRHDLQRVNRQSKFGRLLVQKLFQSRLNAADQNVAAVFRAPNQVKLQRENCISVFGVPRHYLYYTTGRYITKGDAAIPPSAKANGPLAA